MAILAVCEEVHSWGETEVAAQQSENSQVETINLSVWVSAYELSLGVVNPSYMIHLEHALLFGEEHWECAQGGGHLGLRVSPA